MASDHDLSRPVGYDPADGMYHVEHDWTGGIPLSYTVLTAVAAITGDEPHALDPLTETIDPDALDGLFDPERIGAGGTDGVLTFGYNGCRVAVHADGHLAIEPPAE